MDAGQTVKTTDANLGKIGLPCTGICKCMDCLNTREDEGWSYENEIETCIDSNDDEYD